jgi:hypothetical protein
MELCEISATKKDTAIVVSVNTMFYESEKIPHALAVEIVTQKKDADGINILMPVFLPYKKERARELYSAIIHNEVFAAEIEFENIIIIPKKSGGFFATATDLKIVN